VVELNDVIRKNPRWFDGREMKIAGDVNYWLRRKRDRLYLLRSTYAFTDMLGGRKRLHYRLNRIDPDTLKVGSLVGPEFANTQEVGAWLILEGGE
jgi:hypothetical protein